jgi:adenylate cyclase
MLLDQGATVEEVREAAKHGQPHLSALSVALVVYPPGRNAVTEAARKLNVPVSQIQQWWRDLGWADPSLPGGELNFFDLRLVQILAQRFPMGLLSEDVIADFLRTTATSVESIAESMRNTLRIAVDQPARATGASALEVADTHRRILQLLLPDFFEALQIIFRRAVVAGAPADVAVNEGGEVWSERTMVFVDLVDYSALARGRGAQLAEVLDDFERAVAGCATDYGGRLVKLLGDGAMLTFAGRDAGISAATTLVGDAQLPQCRAGVATGLVMLRHADYFGPVVNLASRLATVIDAGAVAIDDSEDVPGAARLPPTMLKGLDEPVTPYVLGAG